MNFQEFQKIIDSIAAKDTSAHPEEWSENNPLLGHCTIVSILAQDVFGGNIMRVDLRKVEGFEDIKWHSWNKLSNGEEFDFTKSQLDKALPKNLKPYIITRDKLFIYPTIEKRYILLKDRFNTMLYKRQKKNKFL